MSVGAFLRRELIVSVRRGTAFSDRRASVILASLVVAGCLLAWWWRGWDRASIAGAASFSSATFAWIVATGVVAAVGLIPAAIAPAIASERDRRSLDSLLATRLSAAEIVLGTLGAGLLRYGNWLVAPAPVVTLLVYLGGIDPRLVLLAGVGVISTAIALASLSAAASATCRSAARAVSASVVLAILWIGMPQTILLVLPRIWPTAATWLAPSALLALESSPSGLAFSLLGVIGRGPPLDVLARMVSLQIAASAGLVAWAIVRLRPASRAAYDAEGRAAYLHSLRTRRRPRPACGDDPVLWREMYSGRTPNLVALWAGRALHTSWVGLVAYGISLFAMPAFAELSRHGYRAFPGARGASEINPIVRVLVGKVEGLPAGPAPGQARPELNDVLRIATWFFDFLLVLMLAGMASETVAAERERETWLGLLATPLSGREILRAKLLGSIWKVRWLAILMIACWLVGLLAGAVHPLGFVVELTGLGISCWFLGALGVTASLRSKDRGQATGRALPPVLLLACLGAVPFIVPGTLSVALAAGTMPFQAWSSLLSYEDLHAVAHAQPVPRFAAIGAGGGAVTWIVLTGWLLSSTVQAVAASLLMRAAIRGFDAAVGRPTRSHSAPRGSP